MNIAEYKNRVTENVVNLMLEFHEEEALREAAQMCGKLMERYLDALGAMSDPTDEAIMEQVKELVLALNDLNEENDYELIETEEREAIWEVIQSSAVECGLQDASDDVTEEWRDW